MKLSLRPYQERIITLGTNIVRTRGLLYLMLATRTGKTLISLSIANHLGAQRVLFLTKRKAISSILADYGLSGYGFVLNILSMDSADKAGRGYDLIIIDEAHAIGAYPKPSLRAKRIKMVVGNTPVIFLSATPAPESWSSIYHQVWVSARSPFVQFRNFYEWAKAGYVVTKERRLSGVTIRDYSQADMAHIKADIVPYMITLSQEEAGFAQNIQEHFMLVTMHPGIPGLIRKLLTNRYYQFKDGSEIVCDTPAKLASKVHQIASGTVLDEIGVGHILDDAKGRAIREKFKNRKIVIFYKFVTEFELLKKVFQNWTDDPEIFRLEKDSVFLGQFISAREGLELSTADCAVFFNIDFAWLSFAQARERIQRKDRETQPELWWVFSDTGVEEKIHRVVMKKRKYTAAIFTKDWLEDDRTIYSKQDTLFSPGAGGIHH
jgi:hypothetical protein